MDEVTENSPTYESSPLPNWITSKYFSVVAISQVIVFFFMSVDSAYYFWGLELPDPFGMISLGLFSNSPYRRPLQLTLMLLPSMLLGIFLLLYPQSAYFYNRMRWFGFGMIAFWIHLPISNYLETLAIRQNDYDKFNRISSFTNTISGVILLYIVISAYFLPRQTTEQRAQRLKIFYAGIAVVIIYMGVSIISAIVINFLINQGNAVDTMVWSAHISNISLLLLSVLFIYIVFSIRNLYLAEHRIVQIQELYPSGVDVEEDL